MFKEVKHVKLSELSAAFHSVIMDLQVYLNKLECRGKVHLFQ